MFSLLVLVATTGLTVAFFFWRRSSLPRSRMEAFIFTCLYCLSLALALRFGGRTYPGIYFPHSPFLNSLLNGNGLFVGVGYMAVLVGWVADSLFILTRSAGRGLVTVLKAAKWLAILLATIIAFYGFFWAATLQRLP